MLMIQHAEVTDFEGTGMHRTVDECIEVSGDPAFTGVIKGNVNGPVLRCADGQLVGAPATSLNFHGQARQAEGGEVRIQVAGAHGQVARLHGVTERERSQMGQIGLPARWCDTSERDGFALRLEPQAVKVLHVIPNRVGPGCPDRHLPGLVHSLRRPAQADPNRLPFRLAKVEMDPDSGTHLSTGRC